MKYALTQFSLDHPKLVLSLVLLVTLGMGLQMRHVHFDNDPENMLAADEPVRLFHHQVKDRYDLYDFVVVGIVNEAHPEGIFNPTTLGRIDGLTRSLLSLERNEAGLPQVRVDGRDEVLDLRPESSIARLRNLAFRHDPNRLFDEAGVPAIIKREIISPSVVDNIKQAAQGSLKLEYLMEHPPQTDAEAAVIRDDAMNNPLYNGTLVSEDGKAMCLYLPMRDKTYSHNVAALVTRLTASWDGPDTVYITGLPVAEDTFGVEMLVQMATSAPLAGLAIFVLMFLFFRKLNLIIAPMVVAVVSIVLTMGLLIGLGYDVHIMSSMIAIFLMPIAVADAIHILSEFYDTYPRFGDKAKTMRHVVGHLFSPMFYTTLTTMAGFASLATTPIPPVKVFGLHVAFGVAMAWLLTMTLVPAFVMLFVSEKSLSSLSTEEHGPQGRLAGFLEGVGAFSFRNARLILGVTLVVLAVSAFGISRIGVNDNPVKWFTPDHPIRIADAVLNAHFGGTYTAYLAIDGRSEATRVEVEAVRAAAAQAFAGHAGLDAYLAAIGEAADQRDQVALFFTRLLEKSAELDGAGGNPWERLADEINYWEPEDLTVAELKTRLAAWSIPAEVQRVFLGALAQVPETAGEPLRSAALAICDQQKGNTFSQFTNELRLNFLAPAFKRPEVLAWLKGLAGFLENDAVVGKTTTVVDALEKAAYELRYQEPADGADGAATSARNEAFFAVPHSVAATAQVYSQLEGMKKKDSLFHLVTRDYQQANIWVQLKSGDNRDMERVVLQAERYLKEHPAPVAVETGWAGLTYINVAWQEKMVTGMLGALFSSFLVVLLMMMVLFRSPIFGLLAMIPLTVTISFTYGLIGLMGKDYDMPIAVLSSLTLGLSVDFAIHFLQRARELEKTMGNWADAIREMFKEPAMAISRNAVTISVGFTPLLLAPLVPYKTVGFFLATIMAVSWLSTLFILSALVTLMRERLFGRKDSGGTP